MTVGTRGRVREAGEKENKGLYSVCWVTNGRGFVYIGYIGNRVLS